MKLKETERARKTEREETGNIQQFSFWLSHFREREREREKKLLSVLKGAH